ncbi:MAG: hypothetical protein IJ808_01475 [Muribaculaceae bacterium]|nr:hypothetical protein [Muribaculaceae bacterium]
MTKLKCRITAALGACVLLFCAMACGSREHFDLTIDVEGLGDSPVHVTYMADEGVQSQWVAPQKGGKRKMRGSSSDYTLVLVADESNVTLATLVVRNGDDVTLQGTTANPESFTVKGSDLTQRWLEFRRDHAAQYASAPQCDVAIENYVRQHPDDVLSAVLLVVDYSDLSPQGKARQLLDGLTARPQNLVGAISLTEPRGLTDVMRAQTLYKHNDDFRTLITAARGSVLFFWSKNDVAHRQFVRRVKELVARSGRDLLVADVLMDTDTAGWTAALKADSTQWEHYWAPGGLVDQSIDYLHVPATPYLIVTDSASRIRFRGSDISTFNLWKVEMK